MLVATGTSQLSSAVPATSLSNLAASPGHELPQANRENQDNPFLTLGGGDAIEVYFISFLFYFYFIILFFKQIEYTLLRELSALSNP